MASRILLADDSITIQKVVNLTFADEGIEVVAVSNGDVAERRLAEVSPDLVLADIFMPGKNGYELCEAIKKNPQYSNVPVVLLVGAFEPFDQTEARRVKADAHLTKPFESRMLVETVRRLISASWRTTTGPISPSPRANDDEALDSRLAETAAAPVSSHLDGHLDFAAMGTTTVAPSSPQVRNTGELASPSPDAREHVMEVIEVPALESVSANLTDTSNRFESLELSPNGDFSPAEVAPPSFNLEVAESQSTAEGHDFTTDPIDVSPLQGSTLSESVPPNALNDVDLSGAGEGADWFNTNYETSGRPSNDGAWRAPTNGSSLSYQTPEYTLQTETGFTSSEASTETACATMLAVDEPLGDVLFDDAATSTALPPIEVLSSELPGLELGDATFAESEVTEPAVAALDITEPEAAVSTQFDLVEITEAPASETPVVIGDNNAAAENFSVETVEPVEHTMAGADEEAAQEAPVSQEALGSVAPPALDPESGAHEVAGDLDWTTPHPASYSTAKLDSGAMPIDAAQYLAEHAAGEAAQRTENTEEASFTAPATWTEEEARFTPIDIEAVAVESPFEASQTAVDMAPENVETYGAIVTEEPANESPEAALSAAAIESIVRRVVAEMSESVVREVAWEVVPDCVERVIEQLTRESLSKRA